MAAPRVSLGALKEPLGLSRGLQWFFSIFAFATCGGFEGSVTVSVTCAGGDNGTEARATNVTATYGYPFRLNQAVFQPSLTHLCNHTWPQDVHLVGDFSSAARFFVGVAVGAFLYSLGALGLYLGYLHLYRCAGSRLPLLVSDIHLLGALGLYLGYLHLYRCAGSRLPLLVSDIHLHRCALGCYLYSLGALGLYLGYLHLYRCAGSRLPLLDLLFSCLGAALWLGASSAWAQGLRHVRAAVTAPLPHCPSPTASCAPPAATPMGGLGASVAFGFLNLLLWAGGSWFVYKETPLHRPAPPPDPAPM
uniref:synaptophysin-like protein 1 n=1 Tax=Agelaius phoeniceus TaxID=39638 RepID=UPI0023EBCAF7|nr:synaptophysin-like protein 1 [Agelaius phoeniceus]